MNYSPYPLAPTDRHPFNVKFTAITSDGMTLIRPPMGDDDDEFQVTAVAWRDRPHRRAWAHLMAAAPELFDLLEGAVSVMERMDADLVAMGKGRDLTAVPGHAGTDFLKLCKKTVTTLKEHGRRLAPRPYDDAVDGHIVTDAISGAMQVGGSWLEYCRDCFADEGIIPPANLDTLAFEAARAAGAFEKNPR